MFALAFYDSLAGRLLLARDHGGIKPLYYFKSSEGFVFGSQYDQILSHPYPRGSEVSEDALGLYLRTAFIPAPYGLLAGSHMLEPRSWIEIESSGESKQGTFFQFPVFQNPDLFGKEAFEAVDAATTAAVSRQLVSDVPLGAFLSGGMDSPLVTARVVKSSLERIKAFTIGIRDHRIDESSDAAAYATELDVEHYSHQFSNNDAIQLIDDTTAACGEPFADFSIFPQSWSVPWLEKRSPSCYRVMVETNSSGAAHDASALL